MIISWQEEPVITFTRQLLRYIHPIHISTVVVVFSRLIKMEQIRGDSPIELGFERRMEEIDLVGLMGNLFEAIPF